MYLDTANSKIMTASGEVGTAGKPVRVFSVSALSGGTAGVSTLKNNGSGGTTWITMTCAAVSTSTQFDFGEKGIRFPNGCYWTKDANTTSVVVSYREEA